MRLIKLGGCLINPAFIWLAEFDDATKTLILHFTGIGARTFTGDAAADLYAKWVDAAESAADAK